MDEWKYTYDDPLKSGHKQFKLSREQHDAFFPNRPRHWAARFEYYYNENHVLIHQFTNWMGISISTILFPVYVFMYGFKDTLKEFKRLYNEKETGSFVSDHVSSRTEKYKEIMMIIKGVNK